MRVLAIGTYIKFYHISMWGTGRTVAGGGVQGQGLQLQVQAPLPRAAHAQQHHLGKPAVFRI